MTRFVLAAIVAIIGAISYLSTNQENPVTGEKQYVKFSPKQEIALGIEMAPTMARQMGGLHPNAEVQNYVRTLGQSIV